MIAFIKRLFNRLKGNKPVKPIPPAEGAICFDSSVNKVKMYVNGEWIEVVMDPNVSSDVLSTHMRLGIPIPVVPNVLNK